MKGTFIVFFLLQACVAAGQPPAVLAGESADGKTVRLLWFLSKWDGTISGFEIKRRQAGGPWQPLHTKPVIPEISLAKTYENVDRSVAEQNRLRLKLQGLIRSKQVKQLPATDFRQWLSSGDKALQELNAVLASDYDLALAAGFALVDRTAAPGFGFDYGLFAAGSTNSGPLALYSWMSGTQAKLTPPVALTARPFAKNNTVQLQWTLDTTSKKGLVVAGYHVYKRIATAWKQLNTAPVAGSNNQTVFTWFDRTTPATQNATYAVALQTVFGNRGDKQLYNYRAAENLATLPAPQLSDVAVADNGFHLAWTFPEDKEPLLDGFTVEKGQPSGDWQAVIRRLPASQRRVMEQSPSAPGRSIPFRVKAIYKNEKETVSNVQEVFYLPASALAAPTGLKGRWVKEDGRTFIHLSWDKKPSADTLIEGYHLYVSTPLDTLFSLQGSGPRITGKETSYEVFNTAAADYRFRVAPVSIFSTEGRMSETIMVRAPATVLSMPRLDSFSIDTANRVTLHWRYAEQSGIKGFRLYQNGKEIAGVSSLTRTSQRFVTAPLPADEKYVFTLQAVSEEGVESPVSYPLNVLVYRQRKQR